MGLQDSTMIVNTARPLHLHGSSIDEGAHHNSIEIPKSPGNQTTRERKDT